MTIRNATKVSGKLTSPTKRASFAAPGAREGGHHHAAHAEHGDARQQDQSERQRPPEPGAPDERREREDRDHGDRGGQRDDNRVAHRRAPGSICGITGVRPGSAAAVTIALRGSTTDASGCETIQTSEVIETVTA